MKMQRWIVFCIPFLITVRLFAPNIDTTSGPNLDKSMTITALWTLNAGEHAYGSVAFKEGLQMNGVGTNNLDVYFPVEKSLDLRNGLLTLLNGDLHIAEGTIIYSAAPFSYMRTPASNVRPSVIYLDGDVTISGDSASAGGDVCGLTIDNVIIDGQGHSLILGPNERSGALFFGNNVTIRNVTLKNSWCDLASGTFLKSAGFVPGFATNDCILENVDFSLRPGLPMCFGSIPANARTQRLIINKTVLIRGTGVVLPSFGTQFGVRNGEFNMPIIIRDNANLVLENTQMLKGWFTWSGYGPGYGLQEWVDLFFETERSQLTLNNSTLAIFNTPFHAIYQGERDITMTLTQGTILVEGASSLVSDSQFPQSVSTLYLGDGSDPNNDINIIITPGATLSLEATNTNCLIVMQNVH